MGKNLKGQISIGISIAIILAAAVLCYWNSLYGQFVFDDSVSVLGNMTIKDLSYIRGLGLSGYARAIYYADRPLTHFTYAVNYSINGLSPFGFHLGNLLIHLINAVLVFSLIAMILRSLPLYKEGNYRIAFLTAILFAIHPIQTGAVSYISQRSEILATLFYLAGLVLFLNALQRGFTLSGAGLMTAGILCLPLGLGCKEIIVTLPIAACLVWLYMSRYDEALRGRDRLFMLGLFIIPAMVAAGFKLFSLMKQPFGGVGPSSHINSAEYMMTQLRVIMQYIRLLMLPVGQNADYDIRISSGLLSPPSTIAGLIFVVFLLGAAVYLFRKRHILSFGIFWFFLVLSPTSSFIPISDIIFEHRVYLASVGFFLPVAVCLDYLCAAAPLTGRSRLYSGLAVFLLIIVPLGCLTINRNMVWLNSRLFWEDVAHKSPNKARGYISLGTAYKEGGNIELAAAAYRKGISLADKINKPYYILALALLWAENGRSEQAFALLSETFKLKPEGSPEMYYVAGFASEISGDDDAAITYYRKGLEITPNEVALLCQLANVHRRKGMLDDAARELESAVRSNPRYARAFNDLGSVYEMKGLPVKALASYKEACRLNPAFDEACRNKERVGNISAGESAGAGAQMLRKPEGAPK